MKKSLLITGIGALALTGPAMAQTSGGVTGTVNVTGNVTGICAVVPPGQGDGTTFTETIALGQLNGSDGTLLTSLSGSTSASPAGTFSTRVVCTDNNPQVEVSATPLDESPDNITPATGYSDSIDYSARVAINTASGGVVNFDTRTSDATAASGGLNDLIAAGTQNNVNISVFDLDTVGGNTNLLVVGQYLGVITVSIAPSTWAE